MKIRTAVSIFAVCLFSAALQLAAQATVRVGGSSLRANGQVAQGFQYSGPCPVNLQFGWGVIASAPTSVTYRFARSDGGRSGQARSARLNQPNRSYPLDDSWSIGANTPRFANYSGWVNLIIGYPNPVQSRIGFTIHCQ